MSDIRMKRLFLSVSVLLFAFPFYAKEFRLSDSEGNPVISYQTENNLSVSLAARYISEENSIRYVMTIKNNGTDSYKFDENSISVFAGNSETNEWNYIRYYNASSYFAKKEAEHKAAQVAAGIGIGLIVLDAILDSANPPPPPRHGPPPSHYHRPPPPPRHFRPYSSLFSTWLGVGASAAIISSLMDDFNYSPSHLMQALLFSKTIEPGETASGYFVSDCGYFPDYKVVFNADSDDKAEFVFLRSDREEILHPWSDPKTDRHSLSFGAIFPFGTFSSTFNYIWGGLPVGAYFSMSFSVGSFSGPSAGSLDSSGNVIFKDDYFRDSNGNRYRGNQVLFEPNGKSYSDFVGFTGGLAIKTIPHTWLLLGIGADIEMTYRQGTLKTADSSPAVIAQNVWLDDERANVYFVPQVGFNFVFNFLNFGGTFSWRIGEPENSGPVFGTFVGLSF